MKDPSEEQLSQRQDEAYLDGRLDLFTACLEVETDRHCHECASDPSDRVPQCLNESLGRNWPRNHQRGQASPRQRCPTRLPMSLCDSASEFGHVLMSRSDAFHLRGRLPSQSSLEFRYVERYVSTSA